MDSRNFTISDSYGTRASFWTIQVAAKMIERLTEEGCKGLTIRDNATGEIIRRVERRS
jgi:hypothetical protein